MKAKNKKAREKKKKDADELRENERLESVAKAARMSVEELHTKK